VAILQILHDWSRDKDAPRIFWLDGMAGTGKSAIAREFSRRLRNDQLLGGSFFCSRGGAAEQADVKRILPTLAAFLASQDDVYKGALLPILDSSVFSTSSNLQVQIETLLMQPLSGRSGDPPSLILIVDALDECHDEKSMEDLLEKLISNIPKFPLKLFLTSRPEPHIRARLGFHQSADIRRILRLHDIEQDIVAEDISRYLTNRLHRIHHQLDVRLPDDWPSPCDVANVTRQAGKLFIYAFTAVEYVREDPIGRLDSLSRHVIDAGMPLTQHLDDIYTTILRGASDPKKRTHKERDLSKRILAAILTLRKPMTVSSLADLLHISSHQLRSMLSRLHAVVSVPSEDGIGVLSTFHASFGDFLTDPNRAPADMLLKLSDGHTDISAQSIALMSERLIFNLSQCPTSYLPNSEQKLADIPAALQYACLNFPHHLAASAETDITSLVTSLEDVFRKRFLFWVEALSAAGQSEKASNVISVILTSPALVRFIIPR
jgi:hypothetical protein